MSTRTETPTARPAVDGVKGARILIVESRYYVDIADALIAGAEREIRKNGATSERVVVPGAFEIPGAIALAAGHYDGFVALGCVIRGETTHYDYVCGESARGLMDLAIQQTLAIGYGIVTVTHADQAWARAAIDRGDHGGARPSLAEILSDQPSPSRRQAARLAAVQALYQWQEGQHGPAEIIEQFLGVRTGEAGEGGMRRDADRPLFKDVVEGAAQHKEELEQIVSAALAQDWTWARIDRLVRAILLAGAYELVHSGDVPPRVVINEYVEIAHAFYDQGEPSFINSVLDRVARQVRPAELVK